MALVCRRRPVDDRAREGAHPGAAAQLAAGDGSGLALGAVEPGAAGEPELAGAGDPEASELGATGSLGGALCDGAAQGGSGGVANAPAASSRSDSVA